MTWIYTLASVLVVSLVSFIGVLTFQRDESKMKPLLLVLVSFSAGALLGDVFIHLLPELAEENGVTLSVSLWILGGILTFFVMEKFVQWHHCHLPEEHQQKRTKSFAVMNLVGDGLHNFIDGMVIAGSYLVNFQVGLATTIAVILHEIPQEIGDFGVLMHAGLARGRILLLNFISGVLAVLGAVVILFLPFDSTALLTIILPFTIGGFIYIAGSDLIPELHKEVNPLNSLVQLFSFISGIACMLALLLMEG